MLEVKQTYDIQYSRDGYKHAVILVANDYKHALDKFNGSFKNATITSISFAGPVCI
jgi:hypothetical protein